MGRLEYWLNGACREIVLQAPIYVLHRKKKQLSNDINYRFGLLRIVYIK